MRVSNKNIATGFLCSCLILGSCFFSTVWGDASVLGSSTSASEQIARNGTGRGANAGANKNMNRSGKNLHQNARRDLNGNNYNRHNANYGNMEAGYGQPGYVQPIVPTVPVVPGVVNTNGVINPTYNQNPYTPPRT